MKNLKEYRIYFSALFLLVALSFASCKKDIRGCMDMQANNYNAEANVPGVCSYNPTAVNVYLKVSTAGHGFVSVYVDDVLSGTLTSYFPGVAPECNVSGVVWVTVNPGNHVVRANSEDNFLQWNDYTIFCKQYECTSLALQ